MSDDYFARYAALLGEVRAFNEAQLLQYAITPQGAGWNSPEAQSIRFEQLVKVIRKGPAETLTINDIGCGYGALVEYLAGQGQTLDYRGYDVSSEILATAKRLHPESTWSRVVFRPLEQITAAAYSVASGVFGLKFAHTEEFWRRYVIDTLDLVHRNSERGFSFNMLTAYSDAEKKKDELYYADPCAIFDLCKRRYSRNVALYHDYPLFDFTIVVRQG